MSAIWERIKKEPSLLFALVNATLALVVLFGLPLSEEQSAGIIVFVNAVVGILTRQSVTPNAKFNAEVNKEAANIASEIVNDMTVVDDAELTDAELAMLDRQRDRLNAELDHEFRRRERTQ
jgi:hypothetical protein